MRRFKQITLITALLIVLLTAGPAAAEVRVSAQVDRTQLAPGESLQLTVSIEGADGSLKLEDLPDFKVLPRGSSTSLQFINGRTSRQVAYNYLLIPRKQGALTIPALAVEAGGQTYHTEPITVTVTPPTADKANGDEARDVWVTAEVSSPEPYVGQPITYTFSLINAVQISDAKFQPPEFKGFEAKELEKRNTQRKIINGREHVITQVNYILIPRQAETLTIEAATLQVGVVRPDNRRRSLRGFDSIFDDPFFNRGALEQKVLQTQPLEVRVKPLPAYKGREPFSGLVGRFDLSASVEKNQLTVGDSTTLIITLAGQGNIIDAPTPALQIPPAFKTYADAPQDDIRISPQGYDGKRIYRIALVPVEPGQFNVVPASLTYFDIENQDYIALSATPVQLTVVPGAVAQSTPLTITPAPPADAKQAVTFTGRDILPPKEELDALVSQHPLSLTGFLLWLAVPLIPFGGLVLVQRTRHKDLSPTERMKHKARRALKRAAEAGQNREAVLGHLYQALSAAILAAAGRNGQALTWKEAEALLLECGQEETSARQIADLLARIESSKFGGIHLSEQQLAEMLGATRHTVRKLAP